MRLYMCVNTNTCTHTTIYTHTYTHTYMHTYIHNTGNTRCDITIQQGALESRVLVVGLKECVAAGVKAVIKKREAEKTATVKRVEEELGYNDMDANDSFSAGGKAWGDYDDDEDTGNDGYGNYADYDEYAQ